ncbi:hypothetical protein D5R40_11105 [Okeania hirsuta]|uniref:PEP-CTERM sorting domain-containing protein n=1 Tax=Okeania hirsuta TaxID=1458930 RepID=A0A3N6PED8_9CYAN|nr:hypothetical protein [Okeania hirsuta]RQH44982.1 hypothetical protein D5R40_11105 [Okeania hirsuta]
MIKHNYKLTKFLASGTAALSVLAGFDIFTSPVLAATFFHLNADYANISDVTAQGFEVVLLNESATISIDESTIRTVPGLNRPDAFPPGISQPSLNLSNSTPRNNNTNRVILDYEGTTGETVAPNQYIHILADGCYESGRVKVERTNFTLGTSTPISPELAMPGWFYFGETPGVSCSSEDTTFLVAQDTAPLATEDTPDLFSIFRLNLLDDSDQVFSHIFLEFEGTGEVAFFNDLQQEDLRFTVQSQLVSEFIPTEELTVELDGFSLPSSLIELNPGEEIRVDANEKVPENSFLFGLLLLGSLGSISILKQKLNFPNQVNVNEH